MGAVKAGGRGDREGNRGNWGGKQELQGCCSGAHLLAGQSDPEWRTEPSGSLGEEGLGVGVEHVGQAGIAALAQQQGVMPAQGLLQQPESAIEVGELSARGRR